MWYNVYWLIKWGGINTKTSVSITLKNITDNEITNITTTGIKTQNKLTYLDNQDKYTISVITPQKIILERENDLIKSNLIFESNKTTHSLYHIKEEDITLEINIKTKYLKITDNIIDIAYTITDSNTDYQYKIEMSD